jgi:type II secretory pathway component PulM
MKSMLKSMIPARLQAAWGQRAPGEKRTLLIGAGLLLLAVLGQLIWTAQHERERLRQQLPKQAQQLETVQAGAREWQRLATLPARQAGAVSDSARQQMVASAQALGLVGQWRDMNNFSLRGQCSFDAWVKWLGEMQRNYGLTVTSAKVGKMGAGVVSVEAELSPPVN